MEDRMRHDGGPMESQTLTTGRFPDRDARTGFLRQVQIWNAVEGLPLAFAESLADGEQVQVRTVASARRGIVRLIEAFGGFVADELRSSVGSSGVGSNQPPA
jgi:hypothetical protein